MTRAGPWALVLCLGVTASCGGANREPTVLVETEQRPGEGPRQLIEDRISADERKAADVLRLSIGSGDARVAGWAAVHALRLGIEVEPEAAFAALVKATRAPDPLLRALAWRWLAAAPVSVPLPPPSGSRQGEPGPATAEEIVFAALASASRGEGTPLAELGTSTAACAQKVVPKKATQRRVEQLLTSAQPYAGLELALVMAFVQADRGCHVEVAAQGERRATSRRLLSEVIGVMGIPLEAPPVNPKSPVNLPRDNLVGRLTNPLTASGRGVAISAAVTAEEPELRAMALDALCILALEPVAGDFGAAAAALHAPSPPVAVAGARTFLLLVTRARGLPGT